MDTLGAVLAITALSSLVGVELCVAAFFHPTLERLDDASRIRGRARSAAVLGRAMPLWYVAALLAAAFAAVQGVLSGALLVAMLWAVSTAVLVAVCVVTVLVLVPLNSMLATGDPGTGTDAVAHRSTVARWDALHRARTAALALVLGVEMVAALL